ncbi:siphovirus Gp157 family protein [Paenibacillus puldeungensis]|uniref:Siphovirus Gp157 family protein n=1 Tax=Paenibacillus puldeungensis TaxID=696536 RepID=A0ABW3S3Z6_9BACL
MRLYELSEQYQMLLDMASEDPTNEQLQAMLEGMEGKIDEKIENTIKVVRSLESEAKAIKDEEDRLKSRRTAIENNAKYLKENIEIIMKRMELEKVKGQLFTISLQSNPPKVVVVDEFDIPQKYFVTPEPVPQLQKKDIIEAWKSGKEIPGVLVVQEKSLRVR